MLCTYRPAKIEAKVNLTRAFVDAALHHHANLGDELEARRGRILTIGRIGHVLEVGGAQVQLETAIVLLVLLGHSQLEIALGDGARHRRCQLRCHEE